jgi:hypothetical protein
MCRYQYDNCNDRTCDPSGINVPTDGCDDSWITTYTEVCPIEGCFGATDGTRKGEGYYDNRYNQYVMWKPESESTGNLVTFIKNEYYDRGISRAYLAYDPNGRFGIIEEGVNSGAYGGWAHLYRFSKPGIEYGTCYYILEFEGGDPQNNPISLGYGEMYVDEHRLVYHILTGASRYADH